jgi:hypothetical protein
MDEYPTAYYTKLNNEFHTHYINTLCDMFNDTNIKERYEELKNIKKTPVSVPLYFFLLKERIKACKNY